MPPSAKHYSLFLLISVSLFQCPNWLAEQPTWLRVFSNRSSKIYYTGPMLCGYLNVTSMITRSTLQRSYINAMIFISNVTIFFRLPVMILCFKHVGNWTDLYQSGKKSVPQSCYSVSSACFCRNHGELCSTCPGALGEHTGAHGLCDWMVPWQTTGPKVDSIQEQKCSVQQVKIKHTFPPMFKR